jgi:UDP-glucose 4-epimerase
MNTALISGGAGYLGGNFLLYLLQKNFNVIVIDNFSNSSRHNFRILQNKLRKKYETKFFFYEGNINNRTLIEYISKKHSIDYVYHFAALKSVPESLKKPSYYLLNNFHYAKNFVNIVIKNNKIKSFVFSSSATVYGDTLTYPIKEDSLLKYNNAYGLSKILFEDYLKKISINNNKIKFISLRYFNPLGSFCNNFYPEYLTNNQDSLSSSIKKIIDSDFNNIFYIYGNDYSSNDGTPVRDFIHIEDLLDGHYIVNANLDKLSNYEVFNLGTGQGTSILEFIMELEKSFGRKINYQFMPRRDGDIAISYADVNKIYKYIKWKAKHTISRICKDIVLNQKNEFFKN